MPVYFFALSQVPAIDWGRALAIFVILHLVMYPSSNGYNSYMDRDEQSIGLLEKPPQATRELLYVTVVLDVIAAGAALFVGLVFTACILATIIASHAYSYRGIRLKKYPVPGFLVVIFFQGALTYYMVYHGTDLTAEAPTPWLGMLISALLLGGFYPLTQIYQHEQDIKDDVRTLSYQLGITGTFLFCAVMYVAAEVMLYYYFRETIVSRFLLLQLFFLPVAVYFIRWWRKVARDRRCVDFRHTMRMNFIAASGTNLAFICMIIMNYFKM
jgi:1,4-dihydroxy-2-naphthoate octaprenyltransferase